jgi:hypothetical protein
MKLQKINEYLSNTNKLMVARRKRSGEFIMSIVIPLLDKNTNNYDEINKILDIVFKNDVEEIIEYHLRKEYLSTELFENWKKLRK